MAEHLIGYILSLLHDSDLIRRLYTADDLDHISDKARIEGIQCVLEQMERFNRNLALPSMIMGDYNALPDSETIRFCNEHKDPVIKDVTTEIPVTYHGYGTDAQKIDYIYVSEDITSAVNAVGAWETSFNGIYLSDHYPVFVDVDMDKM